METSQLKEFVDEGKLSVIVENYLSIFVDEIDWSKQLSDAWDKVKNKPNALETYRNVLSFAILLPAIDRTVHIDTDGYLYRCAVNYYKAQFDDRNWAEYLRDKVVKRDIEINEWRTQAISLGVIDPIEYQPYTREAFNRMYERAEYTKALTDTNKTDISRRLKNVVMAYGGAVVTNLFTRHMESVDKIVNWRTGYFVERKIFDVYTPEQVLKIKKKELDGTNDKLVKKIRID